MKAQKKTTVNVTPNYDLNLNMKLDVNDDSDVIMFYFIRLVHAPVQHMKEWCHLYLWCSVPTFFVHSLDELFCSCLFLLC